MWNDIGLMVDGQNMAAPSFYKDDWQWQDMSYTARHWDDSIGGGGDSGAGSWVNEQYTPAGWVLTDAAKQRLGPQWTKNNTTSIGFNAMENSGGQMDGGGMGFGLPEWMVGYRPESEYVSGDNGGYNNTFDVARAQREAEALKAQDPLSMLKSALVKTGEKQGTNIRYVNGVPQLAGSGAWDTNADNRSMNMVAAKALATMATMGAAAPAMAAAQAAGGGLLGTGLGLTQLGQVAGAMNTFTGGNVKGLSEIGMLGGLAGNIGGLANGVSNGINSIGDAAKFGMSGLGALQKGMTLSSMFGGGSNSSGQVRGGPQQRSNNMYAPGMTPPQGGGGSAQPNWLDSIFGLGAGLYSDHQNRDSFKGLNDLFSRREMARQPYEEALARSYSNPESFLEGPEYTAAAAVRGNQLNRNAAKSGRLANDVDREVLMQQHAMGALGDYRKGLQGSLAQEQLPFEIFRDAMTRNANAGGPTAGGLGYGGIAGILNGMGGGAGGAGGIGGLLGSIGRGIGGLFGDGTLDPGTSYGGAEGGEWNDDYYGGSIFSDSWDWSDSNSWMSDMDSWFSDGGDVFTLF